MPYDKEHQRRVTVDLSLLRAAQDKAVSAGLQMKQTAKGDTDWSRLVSFALRNWIDPEAMPSAPPLPDELDQYDLDVLSFLLNQAGPDGLTKSLGERDIAEAVFEGENSRRLARVSIEKLQRLGYITVAYRARGPRGAKYKIEDKALVLRTKE